MIVYIAVWAVMIIASQLVRTDGHVRPDLVLRLLPAGAQRWVEMFNCLVAIAFTFGMVWYGWQVVGTALLLDQRSSSDLQFPIWIYYMALPVGGGLMLVRYIIRLLRYVFLFDPQTMTVGHRRRTRCRPSSRADRRISAPRSRCGPSASWCCSSACSRRACRSSWCSARARRCSISCPASR